MSGSRRGGRKAAADTNGKVNPTLPADAIRCLEALAQMGRYGGTKTEVAAYLITRGLDDLTRTGVLARRWDDEDTAT
jgi:hypothetical protein